MTQAYSRHGYRWTVGMHDMGEVGNLNGAGWKLFNRVAGGHLLKGADAARSTTAW